MPVTYAAPPTTMGARRELIRQIGSTGASDISEYHRTPEISYRPVIHNSVEQAETPFHSICK